MSYMSISLAISQGVKERAEKEKVYGRAEEEELMEREQD